MRAFSLGSDSFPSCCSTTGFLIQVSSPSSHFLSTLLWTIPSPLAAAWHSGLRFTDISPLVSDSLIPSSFAVIMNPQLWQLHGDSTARSSRTLDCLPSCPEWLELQNIGRTAHQERKTSRVFHTSDHLMALSTLRKACFARFSKDGRSCEVIEREMSKGKHGMASIYPRATCGR